MAKTSRERFQMTLEHQDPGQAVLDLGSTPITGINANALARLRAALGLEERKVKIEDPLQLLGQVEEDVRQALHLDIVGITNNMTLYGFPNTGWKPWTMQTGLEVLVPEKFNTTVDAEGRTYLYPQGDMSVPPAAMMPKDGHFFDNLIRGHIDYDDDDEPSGRADYFDDFGVYTDEQLRRIEDNCNYYYNNTEYGLIGGGALAGLGDFAMIPGPSVKHPKGIRDIAEFMVAHYAFPDYIHEIFEMQLETALKNAELFYQAAGDKIQAMQISGTDFGMQTGPYMTLDSYREFYKPYHKRINDWVHTHTRWKTFYHSCGSIVALCACMAAHLTTNVGMPWPVVLVIVLALGALIGLVNGLLVTRVKLWPFIVTLAVSKIVSGCVLLLTNGMPIHFESPLCVFGSGYLGPVPVSVIMMFLIIILGTVFASRTQTGRNVYAIGNNERAAALSGIHVERIKTLVYVICGLLCAFCGIVVAGNLQSADASLGAGYETDVIAAVTIDHLRSIRKAK